MRALIDIIDTTGEPDIITALSDTWETNTGIKMNQDQNIIKVCIDPHCDAVYHNCSAKDKDCTDCGGRIIAINEATYQAKFKSNFFQYNRQTGDFYKPADKENK